MLIDVLIVVGVLFLLFITFLLAKTALYGKSAPDVEPLEGVKIDSETAASHLADMVRCQTISFLDRSKIDPQPFYEIHDLLEKNYPLVHSTLRREKINQFSLLYTWQGENPDLDPVLYASHLDVVPVEASTLSDWQQPPFEGKIVDGFIWGRGTLDTKSTAAAALEAIEHLIGAGFKPQRTIYLGFGHDEEIGGSEGAAKIAILLKERGVHLSAVLDEGGAILQGFLPGIAMPTALIGVGEKGYLTVELVAQGPTGHSAMPPDHTAIGILAQGITRIEAARMPVRMQMFNLMFSYLSTALPFFQRLVFANQWLFGGVIRRRLEKTAMTNAAIHTTKAVTIVAGGVKDNILPSSAKALVNLRLMPGDTIRDVCDRLRKIIGDDRIQLSVSGGGWEASPVSSHESATYFLLAHTIRQFFPAAVVAPYLVLGATDSRYYANLCDHVYRFSPYLATREAMSTVHAANERISVNSLTRMVQFYVQLIQAWNEDVK